MSGTQGMKHYGVETKQEAVRLVVEDHRPYAEVAKRLGVRKSERIEVWVRQYRREGVQAFLKPIGRPRKQAESEAAELKRLRMENALLKKFHTELRSKVLAKRNIGSSITIERNTK